MNLVNSPQHGLFPPQPERERERERERWREGESVPRVVPHTARSPHGVPRTAHRRIWRRSGWRQCDSSGEPGSTDRHRQTQTDTHTDTQTHTHTWITGTCAQFQISPASKSIVIDRILLEIDLRIQSHPPTPWQPCASVLTYCLVKSLASSYEAEETAQTWAP